MKLNTFLCSCILSASLAMPIQAQQTQLEKLDRGAIAIKSSTGVFLSWRSLATDHWSLAFDVYRDGTKINASPIQSKTNFVDTGGNVSSNYTIKAILNDEEIETTDNIDVWAEQYKRLSLQRPTGGVTPAYTVSNNSTTESYPDGQAYDYSPNDCSVGDLDGDGQYETIVKWDRSHALAYSHRGSTGCVCLVAYNLDGTCAW